MGIVESKFDSEAELENWCFSNISDFLGESIFLDKFQIITSSGKKSVPDGFAFNIESHEWYILEAELLKHGVWPHIAEQITRFVVAVQNQDTLRKIRDKLFEHVLSTGIADAVAAKFGTNVDRLLQHIELFIEGTQPSVVIFIDETNQDLNDFAHALQIPTRIYRIKKFHVNSQVEYYSQDNKAPIIVTEPEEKTPSGSQDYDVIEQLGGGSIITGSKGVKCYRLEDGRIVNIKRSKFHEKNNYYWYGINASSLEKVQQMGATHFVFVLGNWGFATVPIDIVKEFCRHTTPSKYADGTVRHYHALISPEPEPELYWSSEVPRYNLVEYCQAFE